MDTSSETKRAPSTGPPARSRPASPVAKFAFGVGRPEKPLNVWRYQLEASGDGTDVTESFTLAKTLPLRLYWAMLGWARGKTNRDGMRTTLERIKAEVEAGQV